MKHLKTGCLFVLGLLTLALCSCGPAQKPEPAPKAAPKVTIAIYNLLSHPILDDSVAGIKAGLAASGYGPERARIIEINANGDMAKLNAFAIELLRGKPDVIIPISTPVTQAVLKEAAPEQKVVFSTVTNPADVGMDKKPRNVTGVSDRVNYEANVDLIFQLFPQTKTIGVPYNAGERNSQFGIDQIKFLAEKRGVRLQLLTISSSQEVMDAVRSMLGKVDVIYVGSDNTVVSSMAGLTKIAYENKLPVIASDSGSVAEGALAAVSVDYKRLGRRAGELAAEILKTNKMPGDVEPIQFLGNSLLLNAKAARALGYEFPKAIKDKADKVFE